MPQVASGDNSYYVLHAMLDAEPTLYVGTILYFLVISLTISLAPQIAVAFVHVVFPKEREAKLRDARERDLAPYTCSICGTTVFKLRNQATLEAQPTRKTDGSHALDTTTVLVDLRVTSGGVKLLRRDKGTERQHRINCCDCGVPLGYKSSPLDVPSRWLYIFGGAVARKARPSAPLNVACADEAIEADCDVRSTAVEPAIKHLTAGEIKRQFAEKALADKARLEADVGADDVSGGDAKASGRSSN